MAQNPFTFQGLDSFFTDWMKMTNSTLGDAGRQWQQFSGGPKQENPFGGFGGSSADVMDSLIKSWRMFSSTFSQPGTVNRNIEGLNELPSIMMRFAQTQIEGLARFQQQVVNKASKSQTGNSGFEAGLFSKQFFADWQRFYEQELSQYLKIPQLGLTRFHQEKFNQLLDKYNLMQSVLGEFMAALFGPVEKSFKVMQNKYLELAESNELSDDAKDYYQMWIKILEKDYNEFFRSPEYIEVLSKTMKIIAEFKAVRDEIIQDALAQFPIPTENEMNELYKEIYRLKKRVRDLEKAAAESSK